MKRRQLPTEVQKLLGTSDQNRRKHQKKILPRYKMAWGVAELRALILTRRGSI
jgi:hypothetical protein